MLAPRDITAWTPHAPWTTEAQVEQDLLITQAVVAIFQDRFLSERDLQRKLSLQSFRADLADVLPVGRTFDVGHAAHVVRTEFLAHLA